MNTGCFNCSKATWDADGCTCKITGLHVANAAIGCERCNDFKLKWIKPEHRPMSNQFKCPVCGRGVYCISRTQHGERRVNICNYPACPWCKSTIYGSEV